MGGEKPVPGVFTPPLLGSPPRGRGKDVPGATFLNLKGITPAWAGKSFRIPCRYRNGRDHPRVGGEKSSKPPAWNIPVGSPPRGRGKDGLAPLYHPDPGITPAWAGKRNSRLRALEKAGDHPRVGGEKLY